MIMDKKTKAIKPLLFPDRSIFKTVLSIDQSYKVCGISLFRYGTLVSVDKLDFEEYQKQNKNIFKYKKDMRKKHKRAILKDYIASIVLDEKVDIIVVERARLRRGGMLSPVTLVTMSELTAAIIDVIPDTIPVVSVDTRAMRNKSFNTPNGSKQLVIDWCNEEMMTPKLWDDRKYVELNDDEADSIAIGVAFIKGVVVEVEE